MSGFIIFVLSLIFIQLLYLKWYTDKVLSMKTEEKIQTYTAQLPSQTRLSQDYHIPMLIIKLSDPKTLYNSLRMEYTLFCFAPRLFSSTKSDQNMVVFCGHGHTSRFALYHWSSFAIAISITFRHQLLGEPPHYQIERPQQTELAIFHYPEPVNQQ